MGALLVEERRIRDCIERDELVLTNIGPDRPGSPLDRLEPEASKVLTQSRLGLLAIPARVRGRA